MSEKGRQATYGILILLVIYTLIIPLLGFAKAPELNDNKIVFVKRVIDGDTIELSNDEKVRYIGIDTPETKHPQKSVQYFGKEAYEANKKLIEGKKVRLEFGIQKRDKYGRLLAYVYIDDLFVNAWLVENGYAQVSTYPPNVKYQETFSKLQQIARNNNKGIWERR